MRTTTSRLLGCVLAAILLGAACNNEDGGGGGSATETTKAPKYDAAEGVESPAVTLRAELTTLFQEHVLLTGITTATQLAGQDPAAAGAVLDQSNVALAGVVTRLYGQPTGDGVLAALRRIVAANLEFAAASVGPDKARLDKVKADLEAITGEVTDLLVAANKQLVPDALKEALEGMHKETQTALTAQAKKDPEANRKLADAAEAAAAPAAVLAGAITKHKAKDLPGKVDSVGAVMRTSLAVELQEHTYLTGLAAATVVAGGELAATAKVLDDNAFELSRAIGAVYGDESAREFLNLWRDQIARLTAFTQAAAAGDQAKMNEARAGLDGFGDAFATFISGANPNLDKDAVARDQARHASSVLAAIQAQVAKDPAQVAKLREAALQAPDTARLLALAIARQFPTKFG